MRIINIIAVGALALSMSSCGIYTKYHTPKDNAVAAEWQKARDAGVDSTQLGNMPWQQVFTDPVLADLIERALANNPSMANAKLNVDIANAQLKGARMLFFPSIVLSPNGAGSSMAGSPIQWTYQIPGTASWEIDVFGKLLNNKNKAKMAYEQTQDYCQATRSQIISGVANTYYAIAAVEAQLALSRSTATLWAQTVETMTSLMEAGRLTKASVVQSDANYRSVLAAICDLEVSRHELDNTMSTLLNVMPQHFDVAADATLAVPATWSNGVPMSALAWRPDVSAAERGMAVAFYAVNAARAAFYPGLTISFTGGFTNQLGTMIKNPGEWFYNLAGSLAMPLFARGQNITNLKVAKAAQKQAVNTFEATVMNAAAEVSNALVKYDKAGERAIILDQQIDDLKKSVDYTNDLLIYANGTYLEVLTAQQSLLQAQLNRIACSLTRAQAVINVYQSTGGGR